MVSSEPVLSKAHPPPLQVEEKAAVGFWFAGGDAAKNRDRLLQSTPPVATLFTSCGGPSRHRR
jgi:hypothetical protein